jgi:hypothetical protein
MGLKGYRLWVMGEMKFNKFNLHRPTSSSSIRSFCRRMDEPADLIVFPPASFVLCLPPALARTTL